MISRNLTVIALITSALFSVSAAFAQATAAPAATSKAAANPNKRFAAQTAKAKECSVEADEKKLKGKARQKFRAECKKAA